MGERSIADESNGARDGYVQTLITQQMLRLPSITALSELVLTVQSTCSLVSVNSFRTSFLPDSEDVKQLAVLSSLAVLKKGDTPFACSKVMARQKTLSVFLTHHCMSSLIPVSLTLKLS